MAIADKPKPRRNYRRKTNKSTVNKTTKKVV